MKVLNTDAVQKLYRGKYNPSAESKTFHNKEIGFLAFRIAAALSAVAIGLPGEGKGLIDHLSADMDKLRDLEQEDAFVNGFSTAVELILKGELTDAKK